MSSAINKQLRPHKIRNKRAKSRDCESFIMRRNLFHRLQVLNIARKRFRPFRFAYIAYIAPFGAERQKRDEEEEDGMERGRRRSTSRSLKHLAHGVGVSWPRGDY